MEYPLVILKGTLLRLTSTVHVVTSIVSIYCLARIAFCGKIYPC